MCDKAIFENEGTLKSVPDCFKNQEMCNKTVDNCPYTLDFVSECCKTQKKCDKAIDTYSSAIKFVAESFMTLEMCDKAGGRGGTIPPNISWSKAFFYVKSENIKFLHMKNMWGFSLFIEEDISDKK